MMIRSMKFGVLVFASVCGLWAADPVPTAESILDRYVEVTGGKQAYAKRTGEIVSAKVDFAAAGISGKVTRYAQAPDKYYSVMELPGIGNVEMGYTEGIAWEKSAMLGPRIKSGAELADTIREATLNATSEWRKLYSKTTFEGEVAVDGQASYKVVLTPTVGRSITMYFQKSSGLVNKMETVASSSQMGDIPVTILVTDYKNFNGIWAPAKTTQKAGGQEFSIIVEKVDLNPEIPADKFELPAEIKTLAAKSADTKAKAAGTK